MAKSPTSAKTKISTSKLKQQAPHSLSLKSPEIPGTSGLVTVDTGYVQDEFASLYVWKEPNLKKAVIVETGTYYSWPKAAQALSSVGLTPKDVSYIVVTHAHLDHAGGAWKFLQECPDATLLAHPRAARHLIDPSKLEGAARAVYGNAIFDRLYLKLEPIPEGRVKIMEEESLLSWGSLCFRFMHTRGHAKHHMCIFEEGSRLIFTGDTFGLKYPGSEFFIPSTSPTDFEPQEAMASIEKIMSLNPSGVALTHYGMVGEAELPDASESLKAGLAISKDLMLEVRRGQQERPVQEWESWVEAELIKFYGGKCSSESVREEMLKLLKMDLKLNAQGIVWSALK